MRGRPRKTKEEKMAAGTLQPCREVANHLSFAPVDRITSPKYMKGYDAQFFQYYSKVLASAGLLTPADLGELEQASIAYREMRKADEAMQSDGASHTTQSGYKQKGADWQIYMDCRKVLSEFYSKYGLNVVSRERIVMPSIDTEEDELEALKNG